MANVSFIIMALSLIAQGCYFWFRDAVTPNLPIQFIVSDIVWVATLLSLLCYWRYPVVTITCSWGLLITVTMCLSSFYFSHNFILMLLMSSAAITNTVFAHYGLYARRNTKQRVTGMKC